MAIEIKVTGEDIAGVRAGAIILGHYEGSPAPGDELAGIDRSLDGGISQLIAQGEIKGKLNEITLVHSLGRVPASRVVVIGLGKKPELDAAKVRGAFAEACRYLRGRGVEDIAVTLLGDGVNNITAESAAGALAEGALLGLYTFRKYMTKKEDEPREIKQIAIGGNEAKRPDMERGAGRGRILAEAANLARDMVNEPSNYMTPAAMAGVAARLAAEAGLEISVLEREQMAALGMGALLGVAQGSQQPPKFIILKYQGGAPGKTDVALVGKGITFDSGGISLKPSEKMEDMKGDMAGGAAVMAALCAISRLKLKANVTALVPATENMPGGRALKPGDVVTAMNGKTIEIISTDAEGRLILADALSYAARNLAPESIIDVATLTGACVVALGEVCTGGFTNKQELLDRVIAAGSASGEIIWQLPMFDDYREQIKSAVADMKNAGGRWAGAITAAKFLAEFIGDVPWVHLDIAGTSQTEKDKGHLVKGATGVPVRTLVNLVMTMTN
ncbi:MAG: leucyl aminopeptidase [Chloroflexi bacterium]|nr:leucyl aminopeptidase [Chloroflexota bacterium]